jgi:hypothetical protein
MVRGILVASVKVSGVPDSFVLIQGSDRQSIGDAETSPEQDFPGDRERS